MGTPVLNNAPSHPFNRIIKYIADNTFGIRVAFLDRVAKLVYSETSSEYEWTIQEFDPGEILANASNIYWAGKWSDREDPLNPPATIRVPRLFIGFRGPYTGHFKEPGQNNGFSSEILSPKGISLPSRFGTICGVGVATSTTDGKDYVIIARHNESGGNIRFAKAEFNAYMNEDAIPVEFDTLPYHSFSDPSDSNMGIVSFSGDGKKAVFLDDTDILRPGDDAPEVYWLFRGLVYSPPKQNRMIRYEIEIDNTLSSVSVNYIVEGPPTADFTNVDTGLYGGAPFVGDLPTTASRFSELTVFLSMVADYEQTICAFYVDQDIKRIQARCNLSHFQTEGGGNNWISQAFQSNGDTAYIVIPDTETRTIDREISLDCTWTLTFPDGYSKVFDASFAYTESGTFDIAGIFIGTGSASGYRPLLTIEIISDGPPTSDDVRINCELGRVPIWQYIDMYNQVYAWSMVGQKIVDSGYPVGENTLNFDMECQIDQFVYDPVSNAVNFEAVPEDSDSSVEERTFVHPYPDLVRYSEISFSSAGAAANFFGVAEFGIQGAPTGKEMDYFQDWIFPYSTNVNRYQAVTLMGGGTTFQSRYNIDGSVFDFTGHYRHSRFVFEQQTVFHLFPAIEQRQMQYATNDLYDNVIGSDAVDIYVANK